MNMLMMQKYIFANLFMLSNKLQVIGDYVIAEDLTIRQWLLTVAIAKQGSKPPTICEVAKLMGSTRQNVKSLAQKLQKKGFLQIEKDENDFRASRLILTNKCRFFCDKQQSLIVAFLSELFKELTKEEINCLYSFIRKMYECTIGLKYNNSISD